MKVKTIYITPRPSFNDWCREFNVSRLYTPRQGIDNAQRIMELWDGFSKCKNIFIKIKTNNDEE